MLKYHYGSKAVVFTLDVLIAITIFALVYFVSVYYVSKASDNGFSQLQMTALGSDILALLDHTGVLGSLNANLTYNKTRELLPAGYDMRITAYTADGFSFDTGNIQLSDRFVGAGKRYFAVGSDYGEARYWIWVKE
ncbi:hypothetical protein J4230_05955 [Candidatus Woesearchaeota archaeon]|nr:hypothetical protein [Candidatus Woesearchaeota archaeon]